MPNSLDRTKEHVLSLGGGRQSTLCVVLAALGEIPIPDHIVIADTGLEIATTWQYLHQHTIPFASQAGLPAIEIARAKEWATYGVYNNQGTAIMPMYTEKGGMMRKYCSGNWKRDVIRRFVAHKTARPQTHQVHWVGYGIEEKRRWVKKVRDPALYLPLVQANITEDTYQYWYNLVGLPMPTKSACYCCPFRDSFVDLTPDEVQATIALENDINDAHEFNGVPKGYFHSSRQPFEQVWQKPNKKVGTPNTCDDGGCFT